MSTRFYPIYQKGGPQLRVFLPNFWLKLIRPGVNQPANVVQFACSMQMTQYDIQNYLEKIYGIEIADVRTRIAQGRTYRQPQKGYVIKDEDTKWAYVTLPKGQTFKFPDLHPENVDEKNEYDKTISEVKKGQEAFLEKSKIRPNVPGWFTI